jgi:hypothetical protein
MVVDVSRLISGVGHRQQVADPSWINHRGTYLRHQVMAVLYSVLRSQASGSGAGFDLFDRGFQPPWSPVTFIRLLGHDA